MHSRLSFPNALDTLDTLNDGDNALYARDALDALDTLDGGDNACDGDCTSVRSSTAKNGILLSARRPPGMAASP